MKTRRDTTKKKKIATKKVTRLANKIGTRAGKKTNTSSNIPLPEGVLKGYTILNGKYVVVGAVIMHGKPVVQASPSYGYHKGSQQITEFPYDNFVNIFKPQKPIEQQKKSTKSSTRSSTRRSTRSSKRP